MALATHSAPKEDRGLMSTRWAPTLIDEIIAVGFPPCILAIKPGTNGIKVGNTTPEELEKAERIPVVKAVTAITFCGFEILARRSVNNPSPPRFSINTIKVFTPQTIRIVFHGICLIDSLASVALFKVNKHPSNKAKKPTSVLNTIVLIIKMMIDHRVNF